VRNIVDGERPNSADRAYLGFDNVVERGKVRCALQVLRVRLQATLDSFEDGLGDAPVRVRSCPIQL
jgi:hypothetical protein